MRASTERSFHRAWGHLLLGFVGFAWFGLTLDPSIMAALSGLAVVFAGIGGQSAVIGTLAAPASALAAVVQLVVA